MPAVSGRTVHTPSGTTITRRRRRAPRVTGSPSPPGSSAVYRPPQTIKGALKSGRPIPAKLRQKYAERISRRGELETAIRRFNRTFRIAKTISGLHGKPPKVEVSAGRRAPYLAYVGGRKAVHLSARGLGETGSIFLDPSARARAKSLMLHELAHIGQERSKRGVPAGKQLTEGGAEAFAQIASHRLGQRFEPEPSPKYSRYRRHVRRKRRPRYFLRRQFR